MTSPTDSHSTDVLPEIRSAWPELDVPLDDMEYWAWVWLDDDCTPAGRGRDRKRAALDDLFGKGNWGKAWYYDDEILDRSAAIGLYEEAYFEHLKNNPLLVEWLCSRACDVYDNSPSNVHSGYDYSIQEMPGTHLQDIAVRRCVARLGRRFEGDHLVEIRGKKSEGYRLNPGQVPFHEPDNVLIDRNAKPGIKRWWLPQSVEAFWQQNKEVFINLQALRYKPVLIGLTGIYCAFHESKVMQLSIGKKDSMVGISDSVGIWALAQLVGKGRAHVEIMNAPELDYDAIRNLPLDEKAFLMDLPGRIEWDALLRLAHKDS